jgi:Radical SAM superfamily/B12 binding domain
MARVLLFTGYDRICLGMRQLSSYLKFHRHECQLIFFKIDSFGPLIKDAQDSICYVTLDNGNLIGSNYDVNPYSDGEFKLLLNEIKEFNPDIVGLSTRSFWLDMPDNMLISKIRKLLPNTLTIAGGYGPSLEPDRFLEKFDIVCVGEGLDPLARLADTVDQKIDFYSIPNLVYHKGDQIIRNPIAPPIQEISKIPFPDWNLENKKLIEQNRVIEGEEMYNTSMYNIFCTWGCPGTCSYCMASQWSNIYKASGYKGFPKIRVRPAEHVIEELKSAKRRYNLKKIKFNDSILAFDLKYTRELMKLYRQEIGLPFNCHISPQFYKPEIVDTLIDSGMENTVVGLQSGDENIRKKIFKRPVTNDQIRKLASQLYKKEIDFSYDLISWNPFEGIGELNNCLDFLDTLPKGPTLTIFRLKIFPTSRFDRLVRDKKPHYLPDNSYMAYIYANELVIRSAETATEVRKIMLSSHDLTSELDTLRLMARDKNARKEKFFIPKDGNIMPEVEVCAI